jgi:rod shape determining protein RodA
MKNMPVSFCDFSIIVSGIVSVWKTIAGQRCWYAIGSFTIQPSEFAKSATSLALAKYLSDSQINLKKPIVKYRFLQLCFLPVLLILPQPDPGCVNIQCVFYCTV